MLEQSEVETNPNPDWAIIWLHGLGADGTDFVDAIPELNLPESAAIRFIFPHAPVIPVTCNGGYQMRAWYDILAFEPLRRIDLAGLIAARAEIRTLIEQERLRGIPARRILLAGFSQGGSLAYAAALTHTERLAGLIALSTYLPAPEHFIPEFTPSNADLPIFIAHGAHDDIVAPQLGQVAYDTLCQAGYCPQWKLSRNLPHAIDREQLREIGKWIAERIQTASQQLTSPKAGYPPTQPPFSDE